MPDSVTVRCSTRFWLSGVAASVSTPSIAGNSIIVSKFSENSALPLHPANNNKRHTKLIRFIILHLYWVSYTPLIDSLCSHSISYNPVRDERIYGFRVNVVSTVSPVVQL